MTNIKFVRETKSYNSRGAFIASLPINIKSNQELLSQLSIYLSFPDYFGFNWDALFECLRDFSWIKEREVVIIHHDLPHLDEKSLKIYLNILNDACQDWKDGEQHYLEIVFPQNLELRVKDLLQSSQ